MSRPDWHDRYAARLRKRRFDVFLAHLRGPDPAKWSPTRTGRGADHDPETDREPQEPF